MQRTVEQTAVLVALLFKRADTKRARISDKTTRLLSRRTKLRVVFLGELTRALDDLGLHMIELERGGFGLIPVSALDGAPAILAKEHLMDDLKKLKRGQIAFEKLRAEVVADGESDEIEE